MGREETTRRGGRIITTIRRFGAAGPPDKDLGASPLNSLNLSEVYSIYEPPHTKKMGMAKTYYVEKLCPSVLRPNLASKKNAGKLQGNIKAYINIFGPPCD
jgi:hypothetical protein